MEMGKLISAHFVATLKDKREEFIDLYLNKTYSKRIKTTKTAVVCIYTPIYLNFNDN